MSFKSAEGFCISYAIFFFFAKAQYTGYLIILALIDSILKIVPSGCMSLMRHGLLVRLKYVEVVSVFTA